MPPDNSDSVRCARDKLQGKDLQDLQDTELVRVLDRCGCNKCFLAPVSHVFAERRDRWSEGDSQISEGIHELDRSTLKFDHVRARETPSPPKLESLGLVLVYRESHSTDPTLRVWREFIFQRRSR